jgi:hypothetical protein
MGLNGFKQPPNPKGIKMSLELSKDQQQRVLKIWKHKEKPLIKQIKDLTPEEQAQAKNLLLVRIIATIKADTKTKRLRLKLLNQKLQEKGISTNTEQMINRKERQKYLKDMEEERTAYNLMPEDIEEIKNETDIIDRER